MSDDGLDEIRELMPTGLIQQALAATDWPTSRRVTSAYVVDNANQRRSVRAIADYCGQAWDPDNTTLGDAKKKHIIRILLDQGFEVRMVHRQSHHDRGFYAEYAATGQLAFDDEHAGGQGTPDLAPQHQQETAPQFKNTANEQLAMGALFLGALAIAHGSADWRRYQKALEWRNRRDHAMWMMLISVLIWGGYGVYDGWNFFDIFPNMEQFVRRVPQPIAWTVGLSVVWFVVMVFCGIVGAFYGDSTFVDRASTAIDIAETFSDDTDEE